MKQPEARRLADALFNMPSKEVDWTVVDSASLELLRQNGEIESMRAERILDIKRIKQMHEANQAMLEVLKEIVEMWDAFVPTDLTAEPHLKARAAIAKGEAK